MNVPHPRTSRHDDADSDPRRQMFLEAMAKVWDHSRAQSRAQLNHAAAMIDAKLGGTLIIRAESTVAASTRGVPEAGYISEGFSFTESGMGR